MGSNPVRVTIAYKTPFDWRFSFTIEIILKNRSFMKKSLFLISILLLNQTVCAQNCPSNKPLFDGENCYSCDEQKTIIVKNCNVCPNRSYEKDCPLIPRPPYISPCKLNQPVQKENVYIKCYGWVPKCQKNYFQDQSDGQCYSCKDISFDKQIQYIDGVPYFAFPKDGIHISKMECLSCSNTQWIENSCYPKCPENSPLFVDGKCEACDAVEERSGYVVSGCSKCRNRMEVKNLHTGESEGCYLKCSQDKPLVGYRSGKCLSCNDPYFQENSISISKDDFVLNCSKCKNNTYG